MKDYLKDIDIIDEKVTKQFLKAVIFISHNTKAQCNWTYLI